MHCNEEIFETMNNQEELNTSNGQEIPENSDSDTDSNYSFLSNPNICDDFEEDGSTCGTFEDEEEDETLKYIFGEDENDDSWKYEPLYDDSEVTLGETINYILSIYVKDKLKKTTLEKILKLLDFVLPKSHKCPKTKYKLMKIIDKIIPSDPALTKKHRICENCSNYIGEWGVTSKVIECNNCNSIKINGAFYEFDLKSLLKTSLENTELPELLKTHNKENDQENIRDLTDGSKYKEPKKM